jgi:predicted lipoprotein with Yx(FWY)xxD motif
MVDRTRAGRIGAGVALTVLIAGACSGGTSSASSPPATQAAQSSSASASTPAGETYEVTVATDAKLGMYLAGEGGKTLYVFKNDKANTSNCSGQCASNWPPFTLDAGEQVKGATGVTGTFSTFARVEGTTQIAYKTAPLYYYAPDQKAGDVKGEGLGGVWSVAKP